MTLGTEVHDQMFRSGGQFVVKPSVLSFQASLELIYRSPEEIKSYVNLARTGGPAPFDPWTGAGPRTGGCGLMLYTTDLYWQGLEPLTRYRWS
ncbi:hypothetical protein TNCV_625511 [Trichonephila clavipes]|nr:hypothetical protein TNCV_625511 [Trichonephila clavipes]